MMVMVITIITIIMVMVITIITILIMVKMVIDSRMMANGKFDSILVFDQNSGQSTLFPSEIR